MYNYTLDKPIKLKTQLKHNRTRWSSILCTQNSRTGLREAFGDDFRRVPHAIMGSVNKNDGIVSSYFNSVYAFFSLTS